MGWRHNSWVGPSARSPQRDETNNLVMCYVSSNNGFSWLLESFAKFQTCHSLFVGMVPNFDQILISTPIGHETKDFEDQTRIRRQGGDFQDNFKTSSFCRSYMEHKFTASLQWANCSHNILEEDTTQSIAA